MLDVTITTPGTVRFLLAAIAILLATVASSEDVHAANPGHNGKIAVSYSNDIWTINVDGGGFQRISSPGDDTRPAWSPDGSKIAFASTRDGDSEIFVMNADGSEQTQITFNPEPDFDPTWSPDGEMLAFVRGGVPAQIYTMTVDGENETALTNGTGIHRDPAWSPDGKHLAFTGNAGTNGSFDIFVMDASGANPTQLTFGEGTEVFANWAPDGSRIAFQSSGTGDLYDVWTMDPDGSDQVNLTEDRSTGEPSPVWSPDGKAILLDPGLGLAFIDPEGQSLGDLGIKAPVVFPDWQPLQEVSGDSDCDDDVDSVDALQDLRYVAALAPEAACINIGDVDCDFDIDSVDALNTLRFIAALPVNLLGECAEIGT